MNLLNFISIALSLFVIYKASNCLLMHRKTLTPQEEIIAVAVWVLSLLNICIDVVLLNLIVPKLLSRFCFGSILFQSLISIFMIGYLVQNKNSTNPIN